MDNNNNNNNNSWQNDPALKNLDLRKIAFISELSRQMNGLPQDKMLPFLMSASQKSQSMNINFSDDETSLILKVLSANMSPEERNRLEMMQRMVGMFNNKS